MLCIFVCVVGIPITMLMLKSVGEIIAQWVNSIATKFEQKIFKRAEPKQVKTKSAVILFSLMVLLIVVTGLLAVHFEDWTFVEGVYFSFVTMSTIGFGDYVPVKQKRPKTTKTRLTFLSGVVVPLYVVAGLCIVSSVLNSIMAAIEERKCRFRCPGCVSRDIRDHVDNEQYTTEERRETKL